MRQRIRNFMEGFVWVWMTLFILWTVFKVYEERQSRRYSHGDRDMRYAVAKVREKNGYLGVSTSTWISGGKLFYYKGTWYRLSSTGGGRE